LHDKFDEFGINRCVQNKMSLKCAKIMDIFSGISKTVDVSRRYEPSNVVASFLDHPVDRVRLTHSVKRLYVKGHCFPSYYLKIGAYTLRQSHTAD